MGRFHDGIRNRINELSVPFVMLKSKVCLTLEITLLPLNDTVMPFMDHMDRLVPEIYK